MITCWYNNVEFSICSTHLILYCYKCQKCISLNKIRILFYNVSQLCELLLTKKNHISKIIRITKNYNDLLDGNSIRFSFLAICWMQRMESHLIFKRIFYSVIRIMLCLSFEEEWQNDFTKTYHITFNYWCYILT